MLLRGLGDFHQCSCRLILPQSSSHFPAASGHSQHIDDDCVLQAVQARCCPTKDAEGAVRPLYVGAINEASCMGCWVDLQHV